MKNLYKNLLFLYAFQLFSQLTVAQGIPEILYYKFNKSGSSVANEASSPPTGTSTASINGALSVGSTAACGSSALVGSGGVSSTDYVDTKWATATSGSWTISFYTDNITSTTTLYYLFSDITAGSFRCFTGGVAGAGNWLLRGGFTDVLMTGGASTTPAINTFVYDASAGYIYAYLNGTLINSVAQSTITMSSTGTLILSGYNSLNGLTTGGILDEFRFYSHALTAAEVAKLKYTGSSSGTVSLAACGSSFKSPSGKFTWTKNGTYYDTIPNAVNCDSFVTLKLDFSSNSASTLNPTTCDYFVSPSTKFIWTKSGKYTDILKNKKGCDSTITINLTIKNSTTNSFKVNTCSKYTSPSGKYTWSTSGKYQDTIPNKVGCDSIMIINLTAGKVSTYAYSITVCNKYKSPSGKKTWTNSGNYKDTIPNYTGCDSIISINLTVNKSTSTTISAKSCDKYKSPSGRYNWIKTGTYLDTIPNKKGCDSIITINLIVNKSTFNQINPSTCGSYTSPSGKYTYGFSIAFFDTIPNKSGCDSIILIDLKLNKITSSVISRTVCNRFLSPSKKHVWLISGRYYDTIPNKKGCDSTITINLTVNNANTSVSQKFTTLTALTDGAQYQWLNCNNNYAIIAGETNQSYKATALGKYAVEVTENSCTDTSICYEITSLGIKGSLDNFLKIMPNPSSGNMVITSSQSLHQASFKVSNTLGETVYLKNNVSGNSLNLDLTELAKGMYMVEIIEKQNTGRVKFIKY